MGGTSVSGYVLNTEHIIKKIPHLPSLTLHGNTTNDGAQPLQDHSYILFCIFTQKKSLLINCLKVFSCGIPFKCQMVLRKFLTEPEISVSRKRCYIPHYRYKKYTITECVRCPSHEMVLYYYSGRLLRNPVKSVSFHIWGDTNESTHSR